jgi:hypothetical protein
MPLLVLLIIGVCSVSSGLCQGMGRGHGLDYDLVSISVDKEPVIDAVDPLWDSIDGIFLRMMSMGEPQLMGIHNTVEIKSVHTKKNIYIYAAWPDYTESIHKKTWTKKADGSWQQSKEDEDRLSFIWDIDQSMIRFSQRRGCIILCHADTENPGKRMMSARFSPGKGDVWHWKAARTNPAGFSDDQYIDAEKRKSDQGSGIYSDNRNQDGSAPAFMFSTGRATAPFLFDSESAPFDDSKFKAGDTLPSYVLKSPKGDRADISAYGIHKNGFWHVVLKRALDTGHDTDVSFVPGKAYTGAAAIFDNAGDERHLKSHIFTLYIE